MYCDVILRFFKSYGGHSAPIVYLLSCAKKAHVLAFGLPLFFSYLYFFSSSLLYSWCFLSYLLPLKKQESRLKKFVS